MTPDDARNYFFQQLPSVRHSGELLRLTQWVLPHLAADPDRPLGDMATMQFRLQLDQDKTYKNGAFIPKADGPFRVWWSCNRNVAEQLKVLEPVFQRGSSGPSFCSGLTHKWTLQGGPSHFASGLSLGPFAKEHARVEAKLNAAQTREEWWKTFLSNTPLWLRTAYNWNKPTPEQKEQLNTAKKTMQALLPMMVKCTAISYSRGEVRVHHFHSSFPKDTISAVSAAPYWTAVMSGQNMLRIGCSNENTLDINGVGQHAQALVKRIEDVCSVHCLLRGVDSLSSWQVDSALAKARMREEEMKKTNRLLDNLDAAQVFGAS